MKGDLSSIIGSFVVFITFLISLTVLNMFIEYNEKRLLDLFDKKIEFYYERSLELIDILNNETNATYPIITIKNVGKISLDPSCFTVYLDNLPVNFTYYIEDLNNDGVVNPGERFNLSLDSTSSGYRKVVVVTCRGNRFETLILFK